jgi:hypothetical protein
MRQRQLRLALGLFIGAISLAVSGAARSPDRIEAVGAGPDCA